MHFYSKPSIMAHSVNPSKYLQQPPWGEPTVTHQHGFTPYVHPPPVDTWATLWRTFRKSISRIAVKRERGAANLDKLCISNQASPRSVSCQVKCSMKLCTCLIILPTPTRDTLEVLPVSTSSRSQCSARMCSSLLQLRRAPTASTMMIKLHLP